MEMAGLEPLRTEPPGKEEGVEDAANRLFLSQIKNLGRAGIPGVSSEDDEALEAVREVAAGQGRVSKARLEAAAREHKAAFIAKREALEAKETAWDRRMEVGGAQGWREASAAVMKASKRLEAAEAELNEADRNHRLALDVQRQAATKETRTAVTAAVKGAKKDDGTPPARKRGNEGFISRQWGTQVLPPGAMHGGRGSTSPSEQGSMVPSAQEQPRMMSSSISGKQMFLCPECGKGHETDREADLCCRVFEVDSLE